jgi:carboxyl-terminal processing protease
MRRKTLLVRFVVLIVGMALSACANLLPQDKEPLTGDYGSPYTPQEHQLRTFEALWKNVQENYIYFDTANVDWEALHSKYVSQIDSGLTNEQFDSLLHDLEGDLPAGTLAFQSRTERITADTTDNSTYGGIGAYIGFQAEPEPHIVILDVMEGSPAEKAGIKAHDSLLKIDGSPILSEEGIASVQRVRGPAGTSVELTVQSPGEAERVVEVTRAQLSSTSKLEAYEIPGKPFAYILVPPLAYDGLMNEIKTNLQTFTTNKTLKGLILDLRVAGSARSWPLEELFTIFHDGEIGEFYNRSATQTATINGQDMFGSQTVPLIILVGKNTIGSPEILAASLQAYDRAIIVGETTPGSVEATTPYNLPDGSRVFIETTSFRLPDGSDIGNNGVKPTFEIEAGWDDVLPNKDPVLDKAIELLEAQQ